MIKLRKLMFVLPNLFTVTSIFFSFYALTLCVGEATPTHLYQASLAIFFAMFFDAFDGRVARLTKTQSQFGVELDSLADVISFGVVPAILVYVWALAPLGAPGMFVCFAYAACGALRLARFNVLAQREGHGGSSRFFVGLPIPLAAGIIVSMVIAHHGARGGEVAPSGQVPIAIFIAVLALLMVSTVRYRTFKDLRLTPRSIGVFLAISVGGVVIATQLHPAYVLASYFSVYLAWGLLESLFMVRRWLLAPRQAAAAGGPATTLTDDEEDEEDDEVEEQDYL